MRAFQAGDTVVEVAGGRGHRSRLRWTGGCLLLSGATWFVFVRPVTPLDFQVFVAAGRVVAHGLTPYPPLGGPQVWSGSAFVYPWLTAWLFAPFSAVSAHAAAVAMSLLSLAAIAAGVWAIAGKRLGQFAGVLLSAPTLDGLQLGTINAVLFLGVCLAWRWRDRPVRVGVVVGVLVMLKLVCWPLTLWLIGTRRWQAAAWAVLTGTALLGVGWLFGPLSATSYMRLLTQLSDHEVYTAAGLQGLLVRAGLGAAIAQLVGVAAGVALIALAAQRSDAVTYGAAVVAALLVSPIVWHHYDLLAAAPLLLVELGAYWYLLLGWVSMSPLACDGVNWHPITVVAIAAVALIALVAIWCAPGRVRRYLPGRARERLAAVTVVGLVAAALAASVDVDAIVPTLGPGLVSVAASISIVIMAWYRTRPMVAGAWHRTGGDGGAIRPTT